ncbi:MAG: hypothetical protein ACI4QX_01070 [Lachnospiraceae bacterium]
MAERIKSKIERCFESIGTGAMASKEDHSEYLKRVDVPGKKIKTWEDAWEALAKEYTGALPLEYKPSEMSLIRETIAYCMAVIER